MKKNYKEPDLKSMELEVLDPVTASGGSGNSETDNAYIPAGDLFTTDPPGGGWF